MAVDPESMSAVTKIADWVVALIGGLVTLVVSGMSWLYKSLAHRVTALENTVVRKEEFSRSETRADLSRQELREGIIGLHSKVEQASKDLEDKIDKVIDYLLKDKK